MTGVLGVLAHFLLELVGTGGGDHAQMVLQILPVHADAVVGHGDDAARLVHGQIDLEILAVHANRIIGQSQIAQLVAGIRGVGDDFAEEDLLVCINGVDHQIQQTLGLGFKLLFCHGK